MAESATSKLESLFEELAQALLTQINPETQLTSDIASGDTSVIDEIFRITDQFDHRQIRHDVRGLPQTLEYVLTHYKKVLREQSDPHLDLKINRLELIERQIKSMATYVEASLTFIQANNTSN